MPILPMSWKSAPSSSRFSACGVEAELGADLEREVGDPARVRRRVLVVRLERVRERLDRGEERPLERLVARGAFASASFVWLREARRAARARARRTRSSGGDRGRDDAPAAVDGERCDREPPSVALGHATRSPRSPRARRSTARVRDRATARGARRGTATRASRRRLLVARREPDERRPSSRSWSQTRGARAREDAARDPRDDALARPRRCLRARRARGANSRSAFALSASRRCAS